MEKAQMISDLVFSKELALQLSSIDQNATNFEELVLKEMKRIQDENPDPGRKALIEVVAQELIDGTRALKPEDYKEPFRSDSIFFKRWARTTMDKLYKTPIDIRYAIVIVSIESLSESALDKFAEEYSDQLLILTMRLKALKIDDIVDRKVKALIAAFSDSPGELVVWAALLKHMADIGNILKTVKPEFKPYVSYRLFVDSTKGRCFNSDTFSEVWHAQKGISMGLDADNYLDQLVPV